MVVILAICLYTIWFTPFIFVFSLVTAIKKAVKGENESRECICAAVSLFLLLFPMIAQVYM